MECSICHNSFQNNRTLFRHQREKHNLFKRCKFHEYICHHCNKRFKLKIELIKHIRSVHLNEGKKKSGSRLFCPLCTCTTFQYYNTLRIHLTKVHGKDILEEGYIFNNETEFFIWKKQVEFENSVLYVQDTAEKKVLKDVVRSYYYCHRSYCPRLIEERKRHLKSLGSNKIGKACPSTITVTKSSTGIYVKYFPTHIGHKCEIRRTSLPKEEKDRIAGKLAAGVKIQHIIEEIRSKKFEDWSKRTDYIQRRDIHNIIRDYNI